MVWGWGKGWGMDVCIPIVQHTIQGLIVCPASLHMGLPAFLFTCTISLLEFYLHPHPRLQPPRPPSPLGLQTFAGYMGGAPCAVPALCARCAKSRPFFTTGSHGSQGPEFCTLQPLLVHQGFFVSV